MPTKGAEALRVALKGKMMNQSELAELLKLTQPTISDWVNGNCLPKLPYLMAIKGIFGIPVDDWMTESDQLMVRTAVRESATFRARKKT